MRLTLEKNGKVLEIYATQRLPWKQFPRKLQRVCDAAFEHVNLPPRTAIVFLNITIKKNANRLGFATAAVDFYNFNEFPEIDADMLIVISRNMSLGRMAKVIAHEFGHIDHMVTYPETLGRVWQKAKEEAYADEFIDKLGARMPRRYAKEIRIVEARDGTFTIRPRRRA